jgi:peptidoglycan/LPS O-acetylase OafA/YrhL
MNFAAAVREDNDMNDTSLSEASVSTYPDLAIEVESRAVAVEPAWLTRGQIPSLNGLRAASILMVLLAHLSQQGTLVPRIWYLTELGHLGVDMFFVISGFLITVLLLREQDRHQTISLKQFYVRRAYRILPAYLFFLAGIALLNGAGAIALDGWDWFGVLTYSVGFLPKPTWDIGHIWSLSVEEHFYLLWPLALCIWPKRGWLVAAITIVASPFLRWFIHEQVPALHVNYCTLTRMDTIAVGCGLAYLATWAPFRRLFDMPARSAYLLTIGLALGVGISERLAQSVLAHQLLVHPLLVAATYAVTIWIWTQHSGTMLGLLLNSKPAVAIGVLSYSIYLWQQPFLNPHSDSWFTQAPWSLLGIMGMSVLSYFLVERPLLQIKDRRCHAQTEIRAAPSER